MLHGHRTDAQNVQGRQWQSPGKSLVKLYLLTCVCTHVHGLVTQPSCKWNSLVSFNKVFFWLKMILDELIWLRAQNPKTKGKIAGLMTDSGYWLNLPSTKPNHTVCADQKWVLGSWGKVFLAFCLDPHYMTTTFCHNMS